MLRFDVPAQRTVAGLSAIRRLAVFAAPTAVRLRAKEGSESAAHGGQKMGKKARSILDCFLPESKPVQVS